METNEHISLETAAQFLKGTLGAEQSLKIKSHVATCDKCRDKLESIRHHYSVWDRWTAKSHGEAYNAVNLENRKAISEAVVNSLQFRLPQLTGLSELDRKRIKKRAESYLANLEDMAQSPQREEHDEFVLLAAAPKQRGNSSSGKGLAVDEKSGNVFLVTISAWVGEKILDKGYLSVVGAQVESRSRDGMEYKTTAPLTLLKEKLSKRFRTIPWLNHLYLHRREVYVELHNPQYFDKADSLLLAIIVAVSKAAAESKGSPEDLVFSADVDMQGNLMDVGRIHEKAGYIASAGGHRLVVSPGNYREVSAAVNKYKEEAFLTFSTVGELFDFLKLRKKADDTASKHVALHAQKARRPIIWKRVGLAAIIAALLSVASLLFFTAQQIDHPHEQLPTVSPPASFEAQFHKFKLFSVSSSRADLEAAVQMGLDVKPNTPLVKAVFIRVSKILMDRVTNRDAAIQILGHYVRYVQDIKEGPEAEQALADTIDPARDLMERYGLSDHRFDEERLGSLIAKILKELGIEK